MSPIRKQLDDIIDCMPEQEQILLFEIAKRFLSDDIATSDDLSAINKAREEFAAGTTTNHQSINWN